MEDARLPLPWGEGAWPHVQSQALAGCLMHNNQIDPESPPMTHAYDVLMDNLAALAVEAMRAPATAVQSYWLILVARQNIAGLCLTPGALLQQAHKETALPLPPWAQPTASHALERL